MPLDATDRVPTTKEDTGQWRKGGRTSGFAADMYDMLMDTSGKKSFYIRDPMTAVIMLKPGLCSFQSLHLEAVTADGSKSGQMLVSEGQPDADGIRQTLIEVFTAKP